MKQFGLIGYPLSHSFSKKYFTEKFQNENILDHQYELYPISSIDEFPNLIDSIENIAGMNVTIPYKEQIVPFLDEIDDGAKSIGAVNTIKISYRNGKKYLKGYNSDVYGFENSLRPLLSDTHKKALILGTGGASKAIKYVLRKMGIEYISATIEEKKENEIGYDEISNEIIIDRTLIINATPLGTYPNIDSCPNIPYDFITDNHVLFDLVYNPEITKFLSNGLKKGATIKNGLEMLHLQAIRSWEIWNLE